MCDDLIVWNDAKGRYEREVDGYLVFAAIKKDEGCVYIQHVESHPELRGTGASAAFMKDLMDILLQDGVRVVPLCGYAAHWISKHADAYNDVL